MLEDIEADKDGVSYVLVFKLSRFGRNVAAEIERENILVQTKEGRKQKARQNGSNTMFDAHLIRTMLDNPVCCGKIAFERRKREKKVRTRDEYHLVKRDEHMLCDGIHEAIIDTNLWEAA